MWLALGIVKVIHEFGHGLSCRKYGGEVHEMGALFLCFSPCLYCNVSDAWTLPSKWKRIVISYAGIYIELTIAATATFVWWNTAGYPFVNNLALCLMVVCSVSTVVFNANPLMRYDGYYVLADWLEIPNLRDRSNRFLKNTVLEYCLGVEVQPETYMTTWRKALFITYAVVSYVYRWVVTYSILIFMASFLKPYKLEVISKMLALAALASMVGWPLWRLGKNLHRRGRLPDMKTGRVVISGTIVAVVLAAFFLVPLPVSRVRQVALVQLQEQAEFPVLLREAGRLEELAKDKDGRPLHDGQYVNKDDVLAVFRNPELDRKLREAKAQVTLYQGQHDAYDRQLADADKEPQRKQQLTLLKANAQKSLEDAQVLQEIIEEQQKRLIVRAPHAGWVINPPHVDEVGKYYDTAQPVPFCTIGDPDRLRVLMPVRPADYRLLKGDRAGLPAGQDLQVTIRVRGRDSHTWSGEWEAMPESEAKTIPPPLSNKAGGPIPVKQSSNPNELVPVNQQYLLSFKIKDADKDKAICPGSLAQVKINCRWRSAAWWVWRTVNDTFDLGLM
jgi:putative peptide zinc metalloprotease protein